MSALKAVRIKSGKCIIGDFRKNERTLYEELRKSDLWKGEPRRDEVYVFVSSTGRQVRFVFGLKKVKSFPGTRYESEQELLDWRGGRIEGSVFSPKMLEDYGNACGLTFHMPTFQDWYRDWYAARH